MRVVPLLAKELDGGGVKETVRTFDTLFWGDFDMLKRVVMVGHTLVVSETERECVGETDNDRPEETVRTTVAVGVGK